MNREKEIMEAAGAMILVIVFACLVLCGAALLLQCSSTDCNATCADAGDVFGCRCECDPEYRCVWEEP